MSLILEALRKSEAERRRGNAPDVAMELPPAAAPRRHATPAWLLPAVAAVALLLVFAWWWNGREPAPSPLPDATAPANALAAAPPSQDTPTVVVRQPALQAPIAQPVPEPAAPAAPPRGITPITYGDRDDAASPPAPPPQVMPPPPPPAAAPGIKLSMHMWDAAPAKRFVILDGQRMGEGERNGDLQVIEILRDGVIVERNGQRARVALP